MRVYVAGASSEIERAEAMIVRLQSLGIEVTCTWPIEVRKSGANPRDATDEQRFEWGVVDFEQVRSADALWFLVPTAPAMTRGAWAELGFAHARGKLIVSSGDTKQSIFCALGDEFGSDEEAFSFLRAHHELIP